MRLLFRCFGSSLSARLLIGYGGAWLVAAALFVALGSWALRTDSHLLTHGAERVIALLIRHLSYTPSGEPRLSPLPAEVQWIFQSTPVDAGYRLSDAQGRSLLWSSARARQLWEGNPALLQPRPPAHLTTALEGVPVRAFAQTLHTPDGRTLWIQVAVSERLAKLRHGALGSTFEASFLLASLLSIALLGLVLWRVLRRALAPIRRVSQEALAIRPQGPWRRLGTQGLPSEIRPLVDSFNQALDRLEDGFERQQRFLADAAHELKTPLALLRAHVELGSCERAAMLEDIDHLSRQVQQLLLLAEVSEPRSYQHEPIDVGRVAEEVLAFLAPLAASRDVSLLCERPGGEVLASPLGDRSALFVLLKNLVENALHLAPPGSIVTLCLGAAALSVRDHGPGIAAEHVPQIFERFWRVPGSREGGAGLGLAICQTIAEAHGWRLSVESTGQGTEQGTEFHLQFAPPAAHVLQA